jgi:hypothetical protein
MKTYVVIYFVSWTIIVTTSPALIMSFSYISYGKVLTWVIFITKIKFISYFCSIVSLNRFENFVYICTPIRHLPIEMILIIIWNKVNNIDLLDLFVEGNKKTID